MKPEPRVLMARKIRLGEDDGRFDLEFWDRVGPEGRFAAAWDAVVDLVRMGKLDEHQLRLRDLLHALSAERVRFLVVGGYAVIHHTEPRFTKDLDVWVAPTAANSLRVMRALKTFGAPTDSLSPRDLQEPDIIYQIGVAPVRVDILTSVPGLKFASAHRRAVTTTYAGVAVRVLSLEDILTAKRAAGRPQDLLDVENLERAAARAGAGRTTEKRAGGLRSTARGGRRAPGETARRRRP